MDMIPVCRDIVRNSRDPVCNMADVSSPQGIRTMG